MFEHIFIILLLFEFKQFTFFMMQFIEHDHNISDKHDKNLHQHNTAFT